jgi:hypothetical protein
MSLVCGIQRPNVRELNYLVLFRVAFPESSRDLSRCPINPLKAPLRHARVSLHVATKSWNR